MFITNILLLLIFLILLLDFYSRNIILLKKCKKKVKEKIKWKKSYFNIQSKSHWDKVIEELEKETKDIL